MADVQRVVFMGMGEPLLNYPEVSETLRQLRSTYARPWVRRPRW